MHHICSGRGGPLSHYMTLSPFCRSLSSATGWRQADEQLAHLDWWPMDVQHTVWSCWAVCPVREQVMGWRSLRKGNPKGNLRACRRFKHSTRNKAPYHNMSSRLYFPDLFTHLQLSLQHSHHFVCVPTPLLHPCSSHSSSEQINGLHHLFLLFYYASFPAGVLLVWRPVWWPSCCQILQNSRNVNTAKTSKLTVTSRWTEPQSKLPSCVVGKQPYLMLVVTSSEVGAFFKLSDSLAADLNPHLREEQAWSRTLVSTPEYPEGRLYFCEENPSWPDKWQSEVRCEYMKETWL